MFGFVIGTLCFLGLIKVARGGHRWGHGGRRGFGSGRQWMLRRLFERLDTTPGQEKVILSAVDEVEKATGGLRGEWQTSRAELARALRGEQLDGAQIREVFARHDSQLEGVRKAVLEGMQRVHEALNPDQRRELAEVIELGGRHGFGHHAGRHWHAQHHGCGSRGSFRGEAVNL